MTQTGITVRLDQETTDKCDYWYRKQGFRSRTAFVKAAIDRYIALANGDYQLPSAEIARINQLVLGQQALVEEVQNLGKSLDKATNVFLNLTDETLPDPDDET